VTTRCPSEWRSSRAWTRVFAQLGCIAVVALFTGACVETTTSADGRAPTMQPVTAPSTPDAAPANAVVLIARPAVDTDGNLWRDRMEVTVYLFAQPFPTPVFREGVLEFSIYPIGQAGTPSAMGTPLRTWSVDPQTLSSLRGMSLPGPCYNIALSLLANGQSDKLPAESVDLAATFKAPNEAPVWTQGVTTIQLGTVASGLRGPARSRPGS